MDPVSATFLVIAFFVSNVTTHIITNNENKKSCDIVKRQCAARITEIEERDCDE